MIKKIELPTELIGKGGVVTKGLNNTLLILSLDDWWKLSDALDSLPLKESRNARKVSRFFVVEADQIDSEDTYVELSEALKEHINGESSADDYDVTYGAGPFGTMCWTVSRSE